MIALLLTLAIFTIVGAAACAVLRIGGERWSSWFLSGVATMGTLLSILGVLSVPLTRLTILVIVTIAAVVAIVLRRRLVRERPAQHSLVPTVVLAVPLVALLALAAILPFRDYDGRVTWLPKAEAIARDGAIDGPFFQGQAGLNLHNRYPLLMPLDVAAVFLARGRVDVEDARWLYVLIAIAALLAARELIATRSAAWVIAAVAWLPVWVMVDGGALAAYNDVAIFAFCGLALLSREHRAAALFLVALVLVKNEGIVVAAAVLLTRRSRTLWLSVAGAVVLLIVWQQRVPAAYDEQYNVLVRNLPSMLHRLPDALRAIALHSVDRATWGWFWPVAALAAVIAHRRALAPLAVVVLVLGVYALTLTVTSWDIAELAKVAVPRLLLHVLMPACAVIAIAADQLSMSTFTGVSR